MISVPNTELGNNLIVMQRALELHQLINVVHRNDDVDVINKEKNLRFLCKNLQFLKDI